jgi:valyl-tRNA synthetase
MGSNLLDKGYHPHDVEKRWYEFWLKEKLFTAKAESAQQSFSIVIPPPNVTGVLHMGHALNRTMQDVLCRYRRLRGDNVLWVPGTDHAGIATQNVVEKQLAQKNVTRHELGREKFVEAVWEWKQQSGSAIINQLKRLGASCDWDRERFTMDAGLSRAVRRVFVQLYNEGLIYRGDYIINWCPRCLTALSDLEVEHEEQDAHLYHIRYPLPDGSNGFVVATTRPETMFGDTAVAVHPEDERYQEMGPGTDMPKVLLPLTRRTIPIIKDDYVDMSFGTGALKVTPAHDPNDFQLGERHQLESLKVISDEGLMLSGAGRFEGMDRFECRKAVVKALKEKGLLVKVEPLKHSVGHCYRCKTVIEPNLSKQWFVSVKPLAEKAIEAVTSGQTRIYPEAWAKTYFEWMYNIRDWCISRQIWWGHQIPAWTCRACHELTVSEETPDVCPFCGSRELEQETDVLDTWFSSALWPFSTMGWPDETPLLKTFYPTSVLITGFDILFFWVARMMMMGIHFMGEVPFKDVYVHALVRDEQGRKMSKSKGNVIDPLHTIDTYGTDAFRFTLAAFAAMGRDIKLSESRVEGYRHFINKLWNAARFSLMHLEEPYEELDLQTASLPDQWILFRLHQLVSEVAEALDGYHFNDAANALYKFVWHEFCDWYLEAAKPALYGKQGDDARDAARRTLWRVLHDTLILLHPFIPFVTEEIWHKLPGTEGSIMQAVYPADAPAFEMTAAIPPEVESRMQLIIGLITGVRNIRGEMNIAPSLTLDVMVHVADDNSRRIVTDDSDLIVNLARLNSLTIEAAGERPKASATAIVDGITIYVYLKGIIDFVKETGRLEKELAKVTKELNGLSRKLNNEEFLAKAPTAVVEKVKTQHAGLQEKQGKLQMTLQKVKEISAD